MQRGWYLGEHEGLHGGVGPGEGLQADRGHGLLRRHRRDDADGEEAAEGKGVSGGWIYRRVEGDRQGEPKEVPHHMLSVQTHSTTAVPHSPLVAGGSRVLVHVLGLVSRDPQASSMELMML